MRRKGLSIQDVSERSGRVATSYVSAIASGRVTNLTTDKLKALAGGLDVDVLELCAVACRLEYPPEAFHILVFLELIAADLYDPEVAETLENLVRLKDKERRAVLEMTRKLLKGKEA